MKKITGLSFIFLGFSLVQSALPDLRPFAATPMPFYGMISPDVHKKWDYFISGYCFACMYPTVQHAPDGYNQDQIDGFVVAHKFAHLAKKQKVVLPSAFVPVIPVGYARWHSELHDTPGRDNARYDKYTHDMAYGLLNNQVVPLNNRVP